MIDIHQSTTATRSHPMLIVDCPLCDAPAPYDTEAETLDCPACTINLVLAADAPVLQLATAA